MYDTLADVYDWLVPEPLLEPEGSVAAFEIVVGELPAGARVLACACGAGQLAVGLAPRGSGPVGLEPATSTHDPEAERYLVTARRR